MAESFLSLRKTFYCPRRWVVWVTLCRAGIQEDLLRFKHFWEKLMPMSYGMKTINVKERLCFGLAEKMNGRSGALLDFGSPSVSDLDQPQSDRPEPLTRAVFGPTHFPCSLTPNSEVYHNSLSLLSNFLHRSMCLLCPVAQNPHSRAQGFYTWEIIIKWGHLGSSFLLVHLSIVVFLLAVPSRLFRTMGLS